MCAFLYMFSERKKQEPELTPQDKKGRRTAIITGFISIGFGVSHKHLTYVPCKLLCFASAP